MTITSIREGTILTQRRLNRALLTRQHLLRRSEMTVPRMLEHLVGMQSQAPNDPFIGLWTRLCGFHPDALSTAMLDRTAVRASLMRGTIHVVTADDYLLLQPLMRPLHERVFPTIDSGKRLHAARIPEVLEASRELLSLEPMTLKALSERLGEQFPALEPGAMAQAARFLLPLVQVTPRGT